MITLLPPPNPGSDEAKALGCVCPRVDNAFGRGISGRWVCRTDCPLHGDEASRGTSAGGTAT